MGIAGTVPVSESDLAVNGGAKAVEGYEATRGGFGLKVGIEEFMALADLWGYGPEVQAKIRSAVTEEEEKVNPSLCRYYNPRPSRVEAFEAYVRELFGAKYALGVNSGTSALMAAYAAAGIGPGCEVIVPAYTFFATAAAVVASRAIPVIAEIDDSYTIDPEDIERKITPSTKAIAPVHMVGVAANMDAIMDIARRHNLVVIEDNAQACGGKYHGRWLGTIGDLGCFSLSSYKVVGAGEAGLVLTNQEMLYIRAQNQHDTAACWRPNRFARERMPGELFAGENYRMSEIEGAINLEQMKGVEAQRVRYNANLTRVLKGLQTFRVTRPRRSNDPEGDLGYQLVLIAENKDAAGRLAAALTAEGVAAGARGTKSSRDWHIYAFWEVILEQKTSTAEGCPFTCPYHTSPLPAYATDMCPRSLDLFERAVFVGINQWWTEADCDKVAAAINKVCAVLG
jgi:8-amino-3,8-dideoxy-alpha-D-manno-octulosonate transaminase